MNTQHTPGPWEVYKGHDGKLGQTHILAHNPNTKLSDYAVAVMVDGNEADARLIAAAPDLLAACEQALRVLREYPEEVKA
ncbi:MAG: hypothetical protein WC455_15570 [Dehalococcoidia bacterium]|jgi:hypothetical protein